jgi:hypothetical protein
VEPRGLVVSRSISRRRFDVRPFAFDQERRRSPLDDHEVDLSPSRIAEVAELDVAPLRILFMVNPFLSTLLVAAILLRGLAPVNWNWLPDARDRK